MEKVNDSLVNHPLPFWSTKEKQRKWGVGEEKTMGKICLLNK